MKNLVDTYLPKTISKSDILFNKLAIKLNETVSDLLKYGYKLPFLCTPSKAEFKTIIPLSKILN